jgi:hypothetical protein
MKQPPEAGGKLLSGLDSGNSWEEKCLLQHGFPHFYVDRNAPYGAEKFRALGFMSVVIPKTAL